MSEPLLLTLPLTMSQIDVECVTMRTPLEDGLYISGEQVMTVVPTDSTVDILGTPTPVFRAEDGRMCVAHHYGVIVRYFSLLRVRFLDERGAERAFVPREMEDRPMAALTPGTVLYSRRDYGFVVYGSTYDHWYEGYRIYRRDPFDITRIAITDDTRRDVFDTVLHAAPCMADYELK